MKRVWSWTTCAIIFVALWWVLADGESSSWLIGVPAILVAMTCVAVLTRGQPPRSISCVGLVRFIPFFLISCFAAGLDVARRALSRRMALEPLLVECRTRLPSGPARVALVNVISLLPGTLAADLDREQLRVHLLDRNHDHERELRQIEEAVAALFGIQLGRPSRPGI